MPTTKESELRTALLISGGGTTAKAVIEACQRGELKGIIPVAVIVSKPKAGGIEKAQALHIPTFVVSPKEFSSKDEFGKALLKLLKELRVNLVSQNGWLPPTPWNVIEQYENMILNQHPGPLDPGREIDFGGKGMYGSAVTCARVAYAWLAGTDFWTEATTHFVTPEFDKGNLIRVSQLEFERITHPVTIADLQAQPQGLIETTSRIQAELLPLEHQNVIETLRMFAEGNVHPYQRPEPLISEGKEIYARQAREIAVQLFPKG